MVDLTNRQILVLRGLVQGITHREIAAQLGVSVRTVDLEAATLRARLRARSSKDLVARALVLESDGELNLSGIRGSVGVDGAGRHGLVFSVKAAIQRERERHTW